MTTAAIIAALAGHSFRFGTEEEFQNGIAWALAESGIECQREADLDQRDRIDFLVGRVGVEVKIKGSLTKLTAQLLRYAQHDAVDELVLVTSERRLANLPLRLNDKKLTVVTISRGFQ